MFCDVDDKKIQKEYYIYEESKVTVAFKTNVVVCVMCVVVI